MAASPLWRSAWAGDGKLELTTGTAEHSSPPPPQAPAHIRTFLEARNSIPLATWKLKPTKSM